MNISEDLSAINKDILTLSDTIILHKRGVAVTINNGKVTDFILEQ